MAIPAARNLTEPEIRQQIKMLQDRIAAMTDHLKAIADGREKAFEAAERREHEEGERRKKLWFPTAKAVFNATDKDDDPSPVAL